jgi:hypothetical protein
VLRVDDRSIVLELVDGTWGKLLIARSRVGADAAGDDRDAGAR